MVKYPPLTQEQKQKLEQYKTSSTKPIQIAKETSIPAKQVAGYLNFIRHGSPVIARQPPSQTEAKPRQENPAPSQTKPSPNEPPKNPIVNGGVKPQTQEVKKMAIENGDLEKIQGLISTAVSKSKEEQAKETAGAVAMALKSFKEDERKEQERLEKERERATLENQIKDLLTKVKPENLVSLCEQHPELCKRVDELEKKVKKEEEKPKEPTHTTAKEYLECPECSGALVNTLGKMAKENEEFSKKIYESLKGQGALETFKKFETSEPPAKPKEGDEGNDKGKGKDGKEAGKETHVF